MYRVSSVLYILTILNHFVLNNVEARLHAEGLIGGTEANAGQIQYQVSFQVHGENICGGGIIDDKHILSAAHCFLDEFGEFRNLPLKVLAGTNKVNENNERNTVDVEKIFMPASYDPFIKPYAGDIAVVKLKKSLNISSHTRLDKLNLPKTMKSYSGEVAVVSGFGWDWVDIYEDDFTGSLEEVGGTSKDVLKYAQTDVLSNAQCQQNYGRRIRDTEICARIRQRDIKNHEGICSGDSGGPLVFNGNTVIGVVSTSPLGCDESMDPGVYTRVSSYRKFIKNALKSIKARDMHVYVLSYDPYMDY